MNEDKMSKNGKILRRKKQLWNEIESLKKIQFSPESEQVDVNEIIKRKKFQYKLLCWESKNKE